VDEGGLIFKKKLFLSQQLFSYIESANLRVALTAAANGGSGTANFLYFSIPVPEALEGT